MRGSASRIGRWRRCLKKGYYSDVLDLKKVATSIAPQRGVLIHQCLENLYSGKDYTTPIQELKVDMDKVFDEERAEWMELPGELYRIMKGYVNHYRSVDSALKTLHTEVEFEIPIGGGHTYSGIIDWIYEDETGVWVVYHKTVKKIPESNELFMDLQTSIYALAAKHVLKRDIQGVVFNHIRTKAPNVPKLLKSGGLSKAACDTDIRTYFAEVRKNGLKEEDYRDMAEKLEGNIFFKRTKVPVSTKTLDILKAEIAETLNLIETLTNRYEKEKAESIFTRNIMKQRCTWDCEFCKLCFADLAGMNTQDILNNDYETKEVKTDAEEES